VVPVPGIDVESPGALAATCVSDVPIDDGLPFRIEVGPSHLTLALHHVVGDALIVTSLLTGLTRAALGGDVPEPLVTPTSPGVTTRALGELARRAIRQRRVGAVDARATRWIEEWESQPSVVHAVFDEATHRGVALGSRRLRVRKSSLVVSLFEQALAAHDLAPAHDVRTVVVDCRRYLSRGMSVRGNFVAGMPMRAPWLEPVGVERELASALDAARPLAFLAHASLSSLRPGGPAAGFGLGDRGSLLPDYSIVGPTKDVTRLPWTGRPRYLGGAHVQHPDSCGVVYSEVGRSPQLTVDHDAAYVPASRISEVLETFGSLARDLVVDDGRSVRSPEP
jgi:hypothetical protein